MIINIPEQSLVVLCGPSGVGKSTWSKKRFHSSEVVSSDHYRWVVSGDENNQRVSKDAFDLVQVVVEKRLANGYFTCVDNNALSHRQKYLDVAKKHNFSVYLLILDVDIETAKKQNKNRNRVVPDDVIDNQYEKFVRTKADAFSEGWTGVYTIAHDTSIRRDNNNFIAEDKTLDIIGDVHGCYNELFSLLQELGYKGIHPSHPMRKAVFVGDYTDRGPNSAGVLGLILKMVGNGNAYAIEGNHDNKLKRALRGNKVKLSNGLDKTLQEEAFQQEAVKSRVAEFLETLPNYLVFNDELVVTHAGIRENMIGRNDGAVRAFCLYGNRLGNDEYGKPIREDWAATYAGRHFICYGHIATSEAVVRGNTICVDTGCVFGGKLTAFTWPDRTITEVKARKVYADRDP